MSSDLLNSLTSLVTPDLVSRIASASGESSTGVNRGLSAALPALLAGFAGKADDTAGFNRLFDLITSPANTSAVLTNPGSWLSDVAGGKSNPLTSLSRDTLAGLFGTRTDAVADALGRHAGLKAGAGRSLLSMAAPLILGFLADIVKKRILNANGLANLLRGERTAVNAALPGDLRTALGLVAAPHDRPVQERAVVAEPAGSRWWLWLIPLLLIPLLWYFLRSRTPATDVTVDTSLTPAQQARPASDTAVAPSGTVGQGAGTDTVATPSARGAAGTINADSARRVRGTEAGAVGAVAVDTVVPVTPPVTEPGTGAMGGQGAAGKDTTRGGKP